MFDTYLHRINLDSLAHRTLLLGGSELLKTPRFLPPDEKRDPTRQEDDWNKAHESFQHCVYSSPAICLLKYK